MPAFILGFDIGGTKCAVVLGAVDVDELRIVDRMQFPTSPQHGPEQTLSHFEHNAREIILRHHIRLADISCLGISCGSPLDSQRGIILNPPNLPGWDKIPVCSYFQERLGIPTLLQNDANACALAEWRWGAGRGCRNMIFLTFGTGFGAGMIFDGRLYTGTCDMSGEIGHVRAADDGPWGYGKAGSFEGFCSGGGIARQAQAMVCHARARGDAVGFAPPDLPLDAIDARIVAEAAHAGDPLALEIYTIVGMYLGRGLSLLIDLLNPERIVIGSVFSRQRNLLWPVAERVIRDEALSLNVACCSVLPTELGEAIGDYACLSVAMDAR